MRAKQNKTAQKLAETKECITKALSNLDALKGLVSVSKEHHRAEGKVVEAIDALREAQEVVRNLPVLIGESGSQSDRSTREASLLEWFTRSETLTQRFGAVMSFFRDQGCGTVVPLEKVAHTLGWCAEGASCDTLNESRYKLEPFRDVGMIQMERDGSNWCYSLTHEGAELIERGIFQDLGVAPSK